MKHTNTNRLTEKRNPICLTKKDISIKTRVANQSKPKTVQNKTNPHQTRAKKLVCFSVQFSVTFARERWNILQNSIKLGAYLRETTTTTTIPTKTETNLRATTEIDESIEPY